MRNGSWNKGVPRTEKEKVNISIGVMRAFYGNKTTKRTKDIKCLICGKVIKWRPSDNKYRRHKFCSRVCYNKYYSIYLSGKNSPIWSKKIKKCLVCNKEFYVKSSHFKLRKTCSKGCMTNFYKKKLIGKNNPHWRGGSVKLICNICKKPYFIAPSLSKNSKWCSNECRFKYWKTPEFRIKQSKMALARGFGRWMKGRNGEKSLRWKGGRWKSSLGYIMLLDRNHPNANKNHYILEHRFVMEKHLGRYLASKEIVHHLNGIKDDNRLENLALCSSRTHHIFIRKLQERINSLEQIQKLFP